MIKRIKQTTLISAGLVAFLIFASMTSAQNTAKPAPKPLIPLKVDVVFSEYEGAKKVSVLPYTLSVNANALGPYQRASLRIGLRVPFTTGAVGNNYQFQYQNIGTEVDCSAESLDIGRFKVFLSLQRSSSYSSPDVRYHDRVYKFDRKPAPPNKTSNPTAGNGSVTIPPEPIFSTFSTGLDLVMHDGQTIQGVMATDPVSGRVLKVDVTLHVVKEP